MDYSRRWAEPQAPPPLPPPYHHPESHLYGAPLPQPVPQHHLPHPVGYSSYHYPYPNPNPNPHPNPYPPGDPENPVRPDPHASHHRIPADPFVNRLYATRGVHDGLHQAPYPYPGQESPSEVPGPGHRPFPADPYAVGVYAPRGAHEGLHPASYSYHGGEGPAGVSGVSYYYHGRGGSEQHGFMVEAIHPFPGANPLGYSAGQPQFSTELEQPISSHMQSPDWNMAMHPTYKLTKKRTQKWTTKVVQSAYCEICKINCDTQEVLTIHKQGKKHQKNLQKLQESITAKEKQEPVATVEKETSVVEEEKSVGEQQKRKRGALATTEELEEKKRRVLEGGAAAEEVKVCTLCNVVVNSQKVYEYHIAGQKHAAMVKKQEEAKPAAESQSHLCSEEETFTQSPRCTE
ncbi:hypothetical protein OPV22_020585 [Ensete ventricosum]|uniref:U1-type domain-containing protein n=1 Tax=Ensete ventricosum TaxID=4639 RepID=A0AAV8QKN3_ENSVE|nr:hypothetical protein OPV22_020585 [Ensete ventricosum]